ncbi:MAG: amidohydrolase family protein [Caldilineaceae bacterium]
MISLPPLKAVGVRFHGARGSMSLGESQGGLPPDRVTENENSILHDCRRVVETFTTPRRLLCSGWSLRRAVRSAFRPDLMREKRGAGMQLWRGCGRPFAHPFGLKPKMKRRSACKRFGYRPGVYAQELEWTGYDVWHAHCVHLNQPEVELFAASGTGVAHCPTSNMRLASGIAPARAMLDAGVHVGLGVDGSASNDSSHLLAEARQALLLQRVQGDPQALSARQALEMATLGGAAVLGRTDIGALAVGKAADIIAFDLNTMAWPAALCMTQWPRCFSAPRKTSTLAWSMARDWCKMAACNRSNCPAW